MNFMFHTTLDAVGNITRVHYESMKCDVSLSQGSVSTLLFKWDEHEHEYILQHTASKQSETVKTWKDILTNDFKVGISEDVAMPVAGVALQDLWVGLDHVHITHVVVGNNASRIWRQICRHYESKVNMPDAT